jgi:ABC-2 type transport system permease protein
VTVATYTRFELLRTLRNRKFLIFALGFPIVLYFLIATPNRDELDIGGSGLSAPLYFMVSLISFGAMTGMLAMGGRIADERSAGWNRQLRITPLRPLVYFRAKVTTGYLTATISIVLLYISGIALGVRLPAESWLEMTGLILVGLLPFAALAVLGGHLLSSDSIGPAIGGATGILAFLGGAWFPLGDGVLHDIGQVLPSYWLVQASRVALGGEAWGLLGWLVVAGWTVGLTVLAARAYRRDTARV